MSTVEEALTAIGHGEIVIVTDDDDREHEGDLIMAADAATPDKVAFYLQHTSGVVCASLTGERCDALELPLMVHDNTEPHRTAFTVSVDAAVGTTTGISAADRSLTLRKLASGGSTAADFVRPGHIFPLRARDGGVLKRAGHTEAATDLVRMAGLKGAGMLCEVVTPDRRAMARTEDLHRLSIEYRLAFITIADLVRYRLQRERLVTEVAHTRIPTRYGDFECRAWQSTLDGIEHVSLSRGDIRGDDAVLVRVHSECLTGDVFGSHRCDCGAQLDDALRLIARHGAGAVVYLRGHEGRGIGIAHKIRAYNLQDHGYDTVDANLMLGLPVDGREYGIGAQILLELGVRRMRLITNSPAKYRGLEGFGIDIVERVSLPSKVTPENERYLQTKHIRMGHLLSTTPAPIEEN